MARTVQVFRACIVGSRGVDGGNSVMCGDPGGDTLGSLYGNGEGCLVVAGIMFDHHGQIKG